MFAPAIKYTSSSSIANKYPKHLASVNCALETRQTKSNTMIADRQTTVEGRVARNFRVHEGNSLRSTEGIAGVDINNAEEPAGSRSLEVVKSSRNA
jgi:hypothetical protein